MPRNNPRRLPSPLDKAKAHEVVWQEVSRVFAAGGLFADASYVYFIGEADDGPLKIGTAKDPIARLRTMQTGNPRRLRVERLLLGNQPMEKLLHEMWARYAIHAPHKRPGTSPGTEWFEAEIRFDLFPIIDGAAAEQVKAAWSDPATFDFHGAERALRAAHIARDFVAETNQRSHLTSYI